MRQLGAQLISDELIIFPVRHHSPACALHLLRLFQARRPSTVLIEGPRSFTSIIPSLTHADAQAPMAVYSYTVHKTGKGEDLDKRVAAFYPFCDYSPELVALREAKRLQIPARFIDLEMAEKSTLETEVVLNDREPRSLLDERHFQRSHYLQALAVQLGCRDHEELWEHLFEIPAPDLSTEAHIAHLTTYCALARRDTSEQLMATDGTLHREAEMAWHIKEALAQRQPGTGPILAVMGGFHAVVMPALLSAPVKRPSLPRSVVSDAHSALIRYSFDRLDRLNGYGAGMTSPAWHQRLWEQIIKHEKAGVSGMVRLRNDVVLTTLYDIALELRQRYGLAIPMPALGAAYEQALGLAVLRNRVAPVRDDLMDAVVSCFIKGDADADGVLVRNVAQSILSGNKLGTVPAGIGSPPLVKDFEFRARRQRLKIDGADTRRVALDIYRRPEHRLTSRMLHGLSLLEVPFAVRIAGPDFVNGTGLDRLQEHWEYTYSPMTEATLVEASVYGVTVPLAVANRYAVRLERQQEEGLSNDALGAAKALIQACVLGLHDHIPRVLSIVRQAIAADAQFQTVTSALTSISLLWESREPLEARDIDELHSVLGAAYERSIFLGNQMQGSVAEQDAKVRALIQLRELLRSTAGRQLDAAIYWKMVRQMYQLDPIPLIRGAASGLLYANGELSDTDLGVALRGHFEGMLSPREAVSFLRGILQTARELAWQQPELLQVLDDLLGHWDESDFVENLPELRMAFAEMTPRETDRIAETVAMLHGKEDLGSLVRHDLSDAQLQANLELSKSVLEVLLADGLPDWESS
jgi:hypothetical protein